YGNKLILILLLYTTATYVKLPRQIRDGGGMNITKDYKIHSGFTIVELLIVIVVIAILAAISFITFTVVQVRATESLLQSDLSNASKKLGAKQVDSGTYAHPALPTDIAPSQGAAFEYTSDGTDYCLTATASRAGVSAYHVTKSGAVTK